MATPFAYDSYQDSLNEAEKRALLAEVSGHDVSTQEPSLQRVNISDLISTQLQVFKQGVLEKLQSPASASNPIQVARIAGKNYIWDGHHRATAEKLKGSKDIWASVIDMDKEED